MSNYQRANFLEPDNRRRCLELAHGKSRLNLTALPIKWCGDDRIRSSGILKYKAYPIS